MKKFALIGMTVILALGSLGVGYAMWSDTVTIDGTAATGSLNLSLELEPIPCNEYYWIDENGDGVIDASELEAGEWLGKDVGSCDAYLTDPETDCATGKEGHETLNIVVDNAYPGYMVYTTFLLHNIGSIPLDVTLYEITGQVTKPDGTVYDLLWTLPGAGYWQEIHEDLNGNGVIDADEPEVINFRITNSLPVQIDPCHVEKREIDLHCKQPLQQESTYEFSVVITVDQWAE